MTPEQEAEVDAYLLAASNLRTTSRGYKALKSLLTTGNLLVIAFDNYNVFVDFTRLLNHLQLEFHYVSFGLELNENSKTEYLENVINRKNLDVKPTYYNNKSNRIGKEERTEYGGWIRTREEKKV